MNCPRRMDAIFSSRRDDFETRASASCINPSATDISSVNSSLRALMLSGSSTNSSPSTSFGATPRSSISFCRAPNTGLTVSIFSYKSLIVSRNFGRDFKTSFGLSSLPERSTSIFSITFCALAIFFLTAETLKISYPCATRGNIKILSKINNLIIRSHL